MEAQTKKLIEKIESRLMYILVTVAVAVAIFGFTHLTKV